jgi:hypothetical protein
MTHSDDVRREIAQIGAMQERGLTRREIAEATGLTVRTVRRRLEAYHKRQRLDGHIAARLDAQGVTDYAGLHSGWLLDRDDTGGGSSLYFYLGPDAGDKISFADAVAEALADMPRLDPMPRAEQNATGLANFIAVADLHVGGEWGSDRLERAYNSAVDDLVVRLPAAEKAVVLELGDLLDANDHKGVTPGSGNNCDVIRDDVLRNKLTAIRMLKRLILRLCENHAQVEVHMLRGNHDETAYMAVMLALAEHFAAVEQVRVVVTDDEYRVVRWGKCGIFPHHGDKADWQVLKDVWADQFAKEWAECSVHRAIWTAHLHHDRRRDMLGAEGEHFRTLAAPNKWARQKGFFGRGSLTGVTLHRDLGETGRTRSNIIGDMK